MAGDIFKFIFFNQNYCIWIQISWKYVPKGPVDKKPALIQIMAWRWIGDKPWWEPISAEFADAYIGLNELAVTTAHDDVIKRKHFPR